MNENDAKFFGIVIVVLLLLVCAGAVAYDAGKETMKEEAIRLRHAEYTSDPEGKPKFTWRSPSE